MSQANDDLELLEAWRDGDERAGSELFGRYFDAMYRFFRSKVEGNVEDLVQQTFLACVRNRDSFRADSSFRTYLYTVARSKLFDVLRRKQRRGLDAPISQLSLRDLRTSPSTWMARQEEHRLLHLALEGLPLELHLAIELFYFEDLSAREVSEVLDIPEGTVRSRVRRAIKQLREQVEQLAGSGPQARRALVQVDSLVASKG